MLWHSYKNTKGVQKLGLRGCKRRWVLGGMTIPSWTGWIIPCTKFRRNREGYDL